MGMDVYGIKPRNKTGEYFRASIWSWRPIHAICETVMDNELPGWAYNDGAGYKTQKECDVLADKIEAFIKAAPEVSYKLPCPKGMGVNHKGQFGKGNLTPYEVDITHLREFIKFLRACGGFKIN